MKDDSMISAGIGVAIFLLVAFNWGLSRIFSRKNNYNWMADLRQLWPDSKYFFKAQIIFMVLCTGGFSYSMMTNGAEHATTTTHLGMLALAARASSAILPILKLFYVSHLGSKVNPLLISTIGVWAVFQFGIAEGLREVAAIFGLFLFLIPGLIIWFRSCLFLPCYAIEGHIVGNAWHRSWELTKGKYWLVSRYLGAVSVSLLAVIGIKELVQGIIFGVKATLTARASEVTNVMAVYSFEAGAWLVAIVLSLATISLDFMFTGLVYKLYAHLSGYESELATAENQT
ncbi:hypothetical protein BH11CYA1_BH11CYA1_02540 [soil metagenome]